MCKLNNIMITLVVFVVIIFVSQFNLSSLGLGMSKIENFTNLEPGTYPVSVTNPLLSSYKERQPPRLSNLTLQELSKMKPVYSANSQKNNNVRYWSSPDNGSCTPADFCDAIYEPNPDMVNKMDISIWNTNNSCSRQVNMYK